MTTHRDGDNDAERPFDLDDLWATSPLLACVLAAGENLDVDKLDAAIADAEFAGLDQLALRVLVTHIRRLRIALRIRRLEALAEPDDLAARMAEEFSDEEFGRVSDLLDDVERQAGCQSPDLVGEAV